VPLVFYEIYFMKFVFVSAFLVFYFLLANRLKSSKSSALLASPKRHCLYRLDLLKNGTNGQGLQSYRVPIYDAGFKQNCYNSL
jgi:hypothetical protein